MTNKAGLWALALTIPVLAYPNSIQAVETQTLASVTNIDCPFDLGSDNRIGNLQVDCLSMQVPQDYGSASVNISFPVVRVRSQTADQVNDEASPPQPRFAYMALPGGPGGKLFFTDVDDLVNEIETHRSISVDLNVDLLLFTPRGGFGAKPFLNCPDIFHQLARDTYRLSDRQAAQSEYVKAITSCREQIQRDGYDLNFFGTRDVVRDIEELKIALNYDQLQLYGVSYGTVYAMEYASKYPMSTSHLILDSPYFLQLNGYPRDAIFNDYIAFHRLFDYCNEHNQCRLNPSSMKEVFVEIYERLNESPVTFQFSDPKTLSPLPVIVDGDWFYKIVYENMYFNWMFDELDEFLVSMDNGNVDHLIYEIMTYLESMDVYFDEQFANLSLVTHYCLDEHLQSKPEFKKPKESVNPDAPWVDINISAYADMAEACTALNIHHRTFSADPNTVIQAPTIILQGKLDPVTISEYVENAPSLFDKLVTIEYDDLSHGIMGGDATCAQLSVDELLLQWNESAESGDCDQGSATWEYH